MGYKVHAINGVVGAIDAADQRVNPDGHTSIEWVGNGHHGSFLVGILEGIFNFFNLSHEKLENLLGSLLLNEFNDAGAFSKLVEVLEHFNCIFDG